MDIIVILLLIIILILSIGAKATWIFVGFTIVAFILWIIIGTILENLKIRKEKRREIRKEYNKQRRAYLNGEISEEEFEYMPKREVEAIKMRMLKDKLYRQNHPELESDL